MTQRTKKIGSTGWMGPRYGIRIRRRVQEIDRIKTSSSACPKCATVTVQRRGSGVYQCRRCHRTFASGAYEFTANPPITRSERSTEETVDVPKR
ncbi:MAG: 50S ribosomal protein L37ae [Thermoplasmata archaeon]|nr:50S ribosomal protein L37ae [Thermoplasmata archaeon]